MLAGIAQASAAVAAEVDEDVAAVRHLQVRVWAARAHSALMCPPHVALFGATSLSSLRVLTTVDRHLLPTTL
jgi:hypothetical protein